MSDAVNQRVVDPLERARRRRVGQALRLWGVTALAGIVVLALLVGWHMLRRGRLLRDRLGPPRIIHWPTQPPSSQDHPPPPST